MASWATRWLLAVKLSVVVSTSPHDTVFRARHYVILMKAFRANTARSASKKACTKKEPTNINHNLQIMDFSADSWRRHQSATRISRFRRRTRTTSTPQMSFPSDHFPNTTTLQNHETSQVQLCQRERITCRVDDRESEKSQVTAVQDTCVAS